MANGVASAIENERFMALHGARVLGRRNSPFARTRKAVPEAAQSVVRKLREEAARGHETVTFIIALSFGLLKDFGLDGARVVVKFAVESAAQSAGSGASLLLNLASLIPAVRVVRIALTVGSYAVGYLGDAAAKAGGQALDLTFMAISLMVSGAIFLLMWGKGWFIKTKARLAWWGLGFFVDSLPLASLLPLTTMSIAYAWWHVRKRSRAAEKKLADIEKMTQNEIEDLDQDISILDRER